MAYYRYYKLQKYVNGQPTGEYSQGARVNDVEYSSYNECMESSETQTRWTITSQTICVGNDKYYVYKEQVSYDGGETWSDTGNTRPGDNPFQTNSRDCGYMEQWKFLDPATDTDYICDDVTKDKYSRKQKQISTDYGETWTDTNIYEKWYVIEAKSVDCGALYRWIETTGYVCDGYTMMSKEKEQVSIDDGVTWTDTGVERQGSTVIETEAADCGYRTEMILEDYENLGTYSTTTTELEDNYMVFMNSYPLDAGQYLLYKFVADSISENHYELNLFDICTSTITDASLNAQQWPVYAGGYKTIHYYDGNDIYRSYYDFDIVTGYGHLNVKRFSDGKIIRYNGAYMEQTFFDSIIISPTELFTIDYNSIYFYTLDWTNETITLANTITIEKILNRAYYNFSHIFWQPSRHLIGATMGITPYNSGQYYTVLIDTTTHTLLKCKKYYSSNGTAGSGALVKCINHTSANIEPHYTNSNPICINKDTMKYDLYVNDFGYKYNYTPVDGNRVTAVNDRTPNALLPCQGRMTRWIDVTDETVCVGTNKCKKQKEQTSSDGGSTWTDTGNTRAGEVIEADSIDCGYIPPNKAYLVYQNNKDKYVTNDSTGILTRRETGGSNTSSSDYYIKKLLTAEISNAVTTLGTACFSGAENLTSVTVPSSVTMSQGSAFVSTKIATFSASGMTGIADNDFDSCSLLTSVSCPNATTIGYRAFGSCHELTSLNLGAVTTIGNEAFLSCTKLNYSIPSTVTSIGETAFAGCDAITSVVIPSGVTELKINTFHGCDGITSVNLGNVQTLGKWVFRTCTSLQSITIPATVTTLGDYVFEGCSSLTSITVLATTPPAAGSEIFKSTSSSKIIYVPAESVEAYKAASGWSTYASKIQAITS